MAEEFSVLNIFVHRDQFVPLWPNHIINKIWIILIQPLCYEDILTHFNTNLIFIIKFVTIFQRFDQYFVCVL